jgi:hypothetical protein
MRFRSCCMSRTDLKTALSTGREARAPRGSGVRTPKMCKLPHGGFHNGNWEAGQGLEASTTSLRARTKRLRPLAPSRRSLWLRLNGATLGSYPLVKPGGALLHAGCHCASSTFPDQGRSCMHGPSFFSCVFEHIPTSSVRL